MTRILLLSPSTNPRETLFSGWQKANAIPVFLDHAGELLVGFESLPLERGLPVLEESPGPAFPLVAPELSEGLLEQISHMQAPVGSQQLFESTAPLQIQILPVGQQSVFLAFDETTFGARQSGILALANVIQSFSQMPHNVEFVEQDGGLRSVASGRKPEWLPHVHHRQANPTTFLGPQPGVELRQAGFRTVLASKPDGPSAQQIAHDNPVSMPLADRYLVDADHQGRWTAHPAYLLAHILLVQLLDGFPIQVQFVGYRLDRRVAASSAHIKGKPPGVKPIVGQPIQTFALHSSALRAGHSAHFQLQIDPHLSTREIARHPRSSIVEAAAQTATLTAGCFFRRRR